MTDAMIDRLLQLSRRERMLLALMAAIVLPALAWLALVPVAERRAAAAAQLQETGALAHWVLERAAEQQRLAPAQAAAPGGPIGISGLEQSLVRAGLRDQVRGLGSEADGRISLRFDAVEFRALMGWLSQNEPVWGYGIAGLHLQRGAAPGLVQAELFLQPRS